MSLFQLGDFVSHSGRTLHFKIDCDALGESDWECVAGIVAASVPAFSAVHGIPRGGVLFASCLQDYITDGANRMLIVDDVWTTGGSMQEARAGWETQYGSAIHGVVLFARGPLTYWCNAVFKLDGSLQ